MPIDTVQHFMHVTTHKNKQVMHNIARLWTIGQQAKSDQDILAAQKVLWSFLQEMFNWETHLLAKQKETGNSYFDQNRPKIRERLIQVYDQHLTLKERKISSKSCSVA